VAAEPEIEDERCGLLRTIAFHHNAKPRKSLGWKSPAELFLPEGSFDFQAYWPTTIKPVALGT